MIKNEMPAGVMQTLTGRSENMPLDADKFYTSKITSPSLSSQTQKLLDESRKLLAKRQRKIFPEEIWLELQHRIFAQLLDLLTLVEKTRKSLLQIGLSDEEIETLKYRNCPSDIENRIICYELGEKFGDLSAFPGFIRTESCAIRLNLNPHLRDSGVLVPQRDSRSRIYCLRVFRSVQDSRSFLLRSTQMTKKESKWTY